MKLGWHFVKAYARNMADIFIFGAAAYTLVYSGKKLIRMANNCIFFEDAYITQSILRALNKEKA